MVVQHVREGEEVVAGVKEHYSVINLVSGMMYGELTFWSGCS